VIYPDNWPRCVCGELCLDGKATCGAAECVLRALNQPFAQVFCSGCGKRIWVEEKHANGAAPVLCETCDRG